MASVKSKSKTEDTERVQVVGAVAERQRATRRRNRGNATKANWGTANAGLLLSAIVAITQHGIAIRFGYSKDGGAFAVGFIGDGEPFTEFTRPTEDIDLYLQSIIDDYSDRGE